MSEKRRYDHGEIQARFTAYLQKALERERWKYSSRSQLGFSKDNLSMDGLCTQERVDETDLADFLPLRMQIADIELEKAIKNLDSFQYSLLCAHVIDGLSHQECAERFHKNFWTVKTTYLRMIRNLREAAKGGEDDGFCRADKKSTGGRSSGDCNSA